MGNSLIIFYKNKVKKSWKIIFISTFIIGLLVHFYKFTNNFLNHDSLFNIYSDQDMLGSGRWFLSFACSFSSYFDLPWVTGLLSIFLISLTAVVVADIFKIENPVLLILAGGLLVSFPAITQTFYFQYTSDGYMLAMLLAALTVGFSTIGDKKLWHVGIASCFICLSCAIYQAYVSFALILAVCHFIQESLEGRRKNKEIGLWIGKQTIIYGIGIAVYYLVWQILMKIRNITPTSYEGLNKIGKIDLNHIIKCFKSVGKQFMTIFTEWDITEHGFTRYSVLNLIFLSFFLVIIIFSAIKSKLYKRKLQFFLSIAALVFIPTIVFIWMFVSPGVRYGMRMEQCVCILFIFSGVLYCNWAKPKVGSLMAIILLFIMLNNSLSANLFYIYMEKTNKSCYAMANEIATRIHLLDDGRVKKIAVIGEISWKLYPSSFKYEPSGLRELGGLKEIRRSILYDENHVAMYLNMIDFQLIYYITHPNAEMPETFKESISPVSNKWKLKFPLCDRTTEKIIKASPEFKEMGRWPASDSVKVIGETVVIKFAEK